MKLSRKSVIIALVAVLGVVAASIVHLAGNRGPAVPHFGDKNPEQISEYLRSDEFRNLDPNTRRATARRAMEQIMVARAKDYCELPPEEQIAYLDEVIDSMQSRRREFRAMRGEFGTRRRGSEPTRGDYQARPEGSGAGRRQTDIRGERFRPRFDGRRPRRRPPGQGGQRGRRRSPERIRARTEFRDPVARAQMRKFREALRQRMRERGIDFGPARR